MTDDDGISNTSGNRPFQEVLSAGVSRRSVMAGGLATAASAFFCTARWNHANAGPGRDIRFKPVLVADGNGPVPVISADYEYSVLIPWGDPIEPDGPAFSYPPRAADQARQLGIGHDGMTFFPLREDGEDQGNRRGLLVINHEFGINSHVLGKPSPSGLADVQTSQHAHGVSVVEIDRQDNGRWRTASSPYARRVHASTPMAFSGPIAGHALLNTAAGNPPLGTINNCSNGETPWRTYLTCEENFNHYFGANDPDWNPTPDQERYGLKKGASKYEWERFDPRFDLSDPRYANEENRFGWVVEIDPFRPDSTPVKRTALGRFKHEGAMVVVGRDDRIVVYMGDDERFDYIYKFVSSASYKRLRDAGKSPLDHGTLYVAKFHEDFTGEWLELTVENPALAGVFEDQASVLTYARKAADLVGATPMDRPEWITVAPDGQVYASLTNNTDRGKKDKPGPDAANPLAPNTHGHIIRWSDSDEHVGLTFNWDIFLVAERTHGTEEAFSHPDGLHADPDGRLFIETDGDQGHGLNNQLLVADTRTGALRRLLTGVVDDEITGIALTPDRRTMFVNIQHPGDGDATKTNFPIANNPPDGKTVPRDATLVITRKDGGIVGS